MRELKIGTSWVRGVVGDSLTPELIVDFACAFGAWCGGGPVVIGRDTRSSSPMLHAAALSGLISQGCEPIDLGVCPTPAASFAVRELGAAGGLSITGGHNDARWNALKFIGSDGVLLNSVKSEELLDIYHAAAFLRVPHYRLRPVTEETAVLDRYLEHLLAAVDAAAIQKRGFRVAVDFCSGSCAAVMGRFLDALGCTLFAINDGSSSRSAAAGSGAALAGVIGHLRADLGATVNVDGDRLAFTCADGAALSEECTLPLVAECRLRRRPGLVVTNLSSSRMVDVVARRHGQKVIRASVGEGYVMDRGLEEEAVLAGEGSGGVGVLPLTMTFDAMLALGLVLETMAESGSEPTEFLRGLPRFAIRKGEIPGSPDQVYRVLDEFRAAYAGRAPDISDGVRVDWDDAWMHVRASNTEPLLRVIVEAETEARAEGIYDDAMALARRAVYRRKG
jgi:phosphomannomutase